MKSLSVLALLAVSSAVPAIAQVPGPYLFVDRGSDPTREGALLRIDARRGPEPIAVKLPSLVVRFIDVPFGAEAQGAEVLIGRNVDPGAANLSARFDFRDANYSFELIANPSGEFRLNGCAPLDTRGFEATTWTRCRVLPTGSETPRPGFWSASTFARVEDEMKAGLLFKGEISLTLDLRERWYEPARAVKAKFHWKTASAALREAHVLFQSVFGRTSNVDPERGATAFALAVGPHIVDPCGLLELPSDFKRKGGLDAAECAALPKEGPSKAAAYSQLRGDLIRSARATFLRDESSGAVSLIATEEAGAIEVTVDAGTTPARTVIGEPAGRFLRYVPTLHFTAF